MIDHPYPWRAICIHCGDVLEKTGVDWPWATKSLHGSYEECPKAPEIDGDPGLHEPRVALSANGRVEDPT